MQAILNSFLLVFVSEMGDKTQLLALVLAARFRKPLPIMAGILVATLLNHALASYLGSFVTNFVSPDILRWTLALSFFAFGIWILLPDKDEGFRERAGWGPFVSTTVAFFFAEMGDKTQLATVALGANYGAPLLVLIGTTIGMLLADGLVVFFGHKLTEKLSMNWIHRMASVMFMLFGAAILLGWT